MRSQSVPDLAIFGRRAIGPGTMTTATTGFRAHGWSLALACSGLLVGGGGTKASTFSTAATGVPMWASMAALTKCSATTVNASRGAIEADATATDDANAAHLTASTFPT